MSIPAFRALWWSTTFSFIAVQMQFLLRGLLAWDLTEREGSLGLVYFVFGLALLVSTPLGGAAADRWRRRRLMIVGQAVLTVASFAMGLLVISDVVQFWMLLVSGGIQGLMFGLAGPARVSFTTTLVGRDLVGNAVTLQSLSMSGTRVFAPALAGTLAGVYVVGIGGAYVVSSAFSVVSLVLLFPLPDKPPLGATHRNPLREIADGVAYVAAHPYLRGLVLTATVVIAFGFNYIAFMPALVEGTFGLDEQFVGYAATASAVGAVAVSLPLARSADGPSARLLLATFGVGFGVTLLALSVAPNYLSAMAVVMVVGACSTGFLALSQSQALRASDEAHQGRVQSLVQTSFAAFGIMAYPLGRLAEWIGLRYMLALLGASIIVATVSFAIIHTPRSEYSLRARG